jgi:hypothetical protein
MSDDRLQRFLAFSAEVTGFTNFDLVGTGQAEPYLSTVIEVVGEAFVDDLLDAYDEVSEQAKDDPALIDNLLRKEIFSDEKLGPVARNVIKLWYVGIWYQVPRDWMEEFGAWEANDMFMVSASAYTEGLLWPAIGANPPGAKGPGYGSWAAPPRLAGDQTGR